MKNKKLKNGGPLITPAMTSESLTLKPIAVKPMVDMRLNADTMMSNFRLDNPIDWQNGKANTQLTVNAMSENYNNGTSLSRTRNKVVREKALGGLTKNENNLVEKLKTLLHGNTNDVFKKEYSLGGQVLSTAAGLIPGIGGILSPMVSLIDQQIGKDNSNVAAPKPMNLNTNLYGNQMANGGMVTNNFKQYNTGSHASGNDLNINASGAGSNTNVTASVQNQENAYTNSTGDTYVHSDVLVNPESGNTFNIDASKLNKKFSKADKSIEDKNALDFTMNRLSILNDKVRTIKESVQMALGGKLETGGPTKTYSTIDDIPNTDYLDAELSIPPSDNIMFDAKLDQLYEQPDPSMVKTMYDTSNIKPRMTERSLPNLNGLVDNSPVKAKDGGITGNSDFNYNMPAMVLKGLGLAKSATDALTSAEVEQPILPNYDKSDQQMYSTNIDYTQAKQDAIGAANLAGNVNRSASGSFEQFQGRQANNYANLADSLGRVSMREALDRNQQYVQRAGYEQGKAVDKANRLSQNRINNQQNAAVSDLADQKFFSELTDIGTEFNQYQVYKDMVVNKKEIANAAINEGLMLSGSKYSNFGFTDDFMERIKSGTASIDEMVKFISTTEKVKTSTKTTQ